MVNDEANKGYRVLCFATTKQDLVNSKLSRPAKPIAFVMIEDQIRSDAPETIKYFRCYRCI